WHVFGDQNIGQDDWHTGQWMVIFAGVDIRGDSQRFVSVNINKRGRGSIQVRLYEFDSRGLACAKLCRHFASGQLCKMHYSPSRISWTMNCPSWDSGAAESACSLDSSLATTSARTLLLTGSGLTVTGSCSSAVTASESIIGSNSAAKRCRSSSVRAMWAVAAMLSTMILLH